MVRPAKDGRGGGLVMVFWLAAIVAIVVAVAHEAAVAGVTGVLASALVSSLDIVVRLIASLFGAPSP